MLKKTLYQCDLNLIKESENFCVSLIKNNNLENNKFTINKPLGKFFYDKWVIKEEFKSTPIDKLLKPLELNENLGETRIIVLKPGTNYYKHTDIDDRFHLSISGNEDSYLIDLEKNKMYNIENDGTWWDMNAGRIHTAANFGNKFRFQLVARKLLNKNMLLNPLTVNISLNSDSYDFRYMFDLSIQKWLNTANKKGYISNFSVLSDNNCVKFDIDKKYLNQLKKLINKDYFKLLIVS